MSRSDPLRMVDISDKEVVHRVAEAAGRIRLKEVTMDAIKKGAVEKGDPLAVAEVACVLAAKSTPEIVPLCHPVPLTSVDAEFTVGAGFVEARCHVSANYRTGVEMEALTGVSAALLTIWDMVKYLEKDENGQYPNTVITDIRVIEKRKG
jgi:cyclic pyranopterin phosphate synthase